MSEPARLLPALPNLEHLRKQARRQLRALRASEPAATLAAAQFALARDYGFASWRQLKCEVERRTGATPPPPDPVAFYRPYLGHYRQDSSLAANIVIEISEIAGRLHLTVAGGPRLPLRELGDGWFGQHGVPRRYRFAETALILETADGTHLRFERTDAATAARMAAARAAARIEQERPRTEIPLSPIQLALCPGHYATPHGPVIEITAEAGRLYARVAGQERYGVHAASETELFYRILPAQLHVDFAEGSAIAVSLHQHGIIQRLPRVDAETAARLFAPVERRAEAQRQPRRHVPVDPALLAHYVGAYRMDADHVVTVAAEAGRLYVGLTGQSRFEVFPESPTRFFWTVTAAQIEFFVEGDGPASYAVLHQHGNAMPLPRLDPSG